MRRRQDIGAGTPVKNWAAILALLVLAMVPLVGCDTGSTSGGTGTTTGTNPVAPAQYGGSYSGGVATGDTAAGEAFAKWVLDQDPNRTMITDAVVREESNLGVKVQPNVTKADVQKLLVALTEGMARTFPGKPLQVSAFYQSGDKLADANFDGSSNQVQVNFVEP